MLLFNASISSADSLFLSRLYLMTKLLPWLVLLDLDLQQDSADCFLQECIPRHYLVS